MINPHKVMEEACQLALMGKGYTKTNPVVGAIVVKDSKIISRGFHTGFGGPHAEIEAIAAAGEDARGADLYVTLEPCSHYGKTPPCTKRIIEAGIKRVFIGVCDPNPLNAGKGIWELLNHKIEVFLGFAETLCAELIEDFAKYIYAKTPYYTLKIAQTLDGKIATPTGESKWITSESSRNYVHYLRSVSDAILVGINTVLKDDPELNPRLVFSENDPVKVVLDNHLKIPENSKLIKNSAEKLIIFTSKKACETEKSKKFMELGIKVFASEENNGLIDLHYVSEKLIENNLLNILVEGGGQIFGSFIRDKMADKIHLFIAPRILGDGVTSVSNSGILKISDALTLGEYSIKKFENDILISSKITNFSKKVLELTERNKNRCSLGL